MIFLDESGEAVAWASTKTQEIIGGISKDFPGETTGKDGLKRMAALLTLGAFLFEATRAGVLGQRKPGEELEELELAMMKIQIMARRQFERANLLLKERKDEGGKG